MLEEGHGFNPSTRQAHSTLFALQAEHTADQLRAELAVVWRQVGWGLGWDVGLALGQHERRGPQTLVIL